MRYETEAEAEIESVHSDSQSMRADPRCQRQRVRRKGNMVVKAEGVGCDDSSVQVESLLVNLDLGPCLAPAPLRGLHLSRSLWKELGKVYRACRRS